MRRSRTRKNFLCMFLTVALLFTLLPVHEVDASSYIQWNYNLDNYQSESRYSLAVEKSTKTFNIGDYLEINRYGNLTDSGMNTTYHATYSSSDPKVAKVNSSTGKVTIVGTGTTVMKITVNKVVYALDLTILSDTAIGKKGRAIDARLTKLAAKKITASNRGSYLTELNAILKAAQSAGLTVDTTYGNPIEKFVDETRAANICYITKYTLFDDIEDALRIYQESVRSHYMTSASAVKKTKKIKINYSGAITAGDIYGMTIPTAGVKVAKNPTSAKLRVVVMKNCNSNTTNTYQYATGTLTIKKGAKSGTVTINRTMATGKYSLRIYFNENSAFGVTLTVK